MAHLLDPQVVPPSQLMNHLSDGIVRRLVPDAR
jgi:hypothetical protein